MSLLWIEGFEGYKTSGSLTSTLLRRRYAGGSHEDAMSIVAGRISGYAMSMQFVDGNIGTFQFDTTDDTLITGFAFKLDILPPSTQHLIAFYDTGTYGVNLRLSSTGELAIYRGTTLLEATVGLNLGLSQWYYVEMKVKCADGVSGTYEVRIDGVVKLSDAATDTKEGTHDYHNQVVIVGPSAYCYFDDWYICDGAGGKNDDFLGNCRVAAISPNGDSSVNWSTVYPALSDHYADVDDGAGCDDDTTYVEDGTTGNRDLFDYAAIPGTLTTVYGVSVETTCRVTDANAVSLKTVVSNNGDETVSGGDSILDSNYKTISFICENDPDTGTNWDVDTINNALYGFEVG